MLLTSNKKKVIERDGNKCRKCGATGDLTVDHIVPKSLGGSDEPSNLETLCFKCNTTKLSTHPLTLRDRIRYVWNTYEHNQSVKEYIVKEVRKILATYMLRKDVAAMVQSEMTKHQNNSIKRMEQVTNRLDILDVKTDVRKETAMLQRLTDVENRVALLEKKPLETINETMETPKIRITATKVRCRDLVPGDLFSGVGQEYWDKVDSSDSIGEKVYIRTNNPYEGENGEDPIYLITMSEI